VACVGEAFFDAADTLVEDAVLDLLANGELLGRRHVGVIQTHLNLHDFFLARRGERFLRDLFDLGRGLALATASDESQEKKGGEGSIQNRWASSRVKVISALALRSPSASSRSRV
jgi:hypothetical protein